MDDVRNVKAEKGYPVYIILSKLHTDIPENILGFHSRTVCDTSSSVFGISKIKHTRSSSQKLQRSLRKIFEFVLPVWQLRCKTEKYTLIC